MKRRHRLAALLAAACLLGPAAQARVTRIMIDETAALPVAAGTPAPDIAYRQIAGRAFGEVDPQLPGNALIQDIRLALDPDGKARYGASFVLVTPVDPAQARAA